jgi:hypothetical protein
VSAESEMRRKRRDAMEGRDGRAGVNDYRWVGGHALRDTVGRVVICIHRAFGLTTSVPLDGKKRCASMLAIWSLNITHTNSTRIYMLKAAK